MASAAVVLEVGARPKGQASRATPTSMTMSLARPRVDRGFPVRAMSGSSMGAMRAMSWLSSVVSPLLEMAMSTSPFVTMPRSPCIPSTGCRKMAGVPVLVKVATILRPMRPDLPIPDTMTRPLAL